tara:strand:- start:29400 stop:29558 length:159 start_codon:yes stop_codon:yes gene_type:complete
MNIDVSSICGKYLEMTIELDSATVKTGTMDHKEAVELARVLIFAAEKLLAGP